MIGVDGLAINPASSSQLCIFLFGGAANLKTKVRTETTRVFKVARDEIPDKAMALYRERDSTQPNEQSSEALDSDERQPDEFDSMKAAQLKALCK